MSHVNVALLGFGNVGRAFVRFLEARAGTLPIEVRVRAAADSSGAVLVDDDSALKRLSLHKAAGKSVAEFAPGEVLTDLSAFIQTLPAAGISVLIESLPTNMASGEPALSFVRSALDQGTNVVTVDKGPLVHGFETLHEAARSSGARLGYSGTTGVNIPDELAGDRVLETRGILNGTTNFILSEMQQRERSFEESLATAQAEGIAEPDPSLDVEGWDTAAKILILAKTLMGAECTLAEVSRIGIGAETESLIRIARESHRIVRLIGRARRWQGRVRVSVAPKLVEAGSPFYSVSGTSKAAIFRTQNRGEILQRARSSRDAISETIINDIARIVNR